MAGSGRVGVAPHSLRAVDARRTRRRRRARRRRPDPYPRRRAGQGGRGLPRLVGRAAGRMAARPRRRRRALVPRPRHPHDDDGDARASRARGAVAGLCPITEANLGDGIFNAPLYLAARRRLRRRLGFQRRDRRRRRAAQLEYAQRLRDRARNVCALAGGSTGRALYERRARRRRAGARRDRAARCAVGAAADIVSLRADHPTARRPQPATQFSTPGSSPVGNPLVDCVWSGGRKVVADGRHLAPRADRRALCGGDAAARA